MKRATTVQEMPNSFRADPLTKDQLAEFYEDTIEVRTGQPGVSDIENIYDACHEVRDRNAHLLMGHWGCGKSTELNRLAKRLETEGIPVETVYCKQELDIINIDFTDIVILLADALIGLAKKHTIRISSSVLNTIHNYQAEIVQESHVDVDAEVSAETGASVETPRLLSIVNIFTRLKSSLKYKETSSKVIRTKVTTRISEWISAINQIADQITGECGKQPILIFEDLDKGDTGRVFSGHGEQLSAMSFPVIYTFPISRAYLPEFTEMDSFFEVSRLPMIEVKKDSGERNTAGFAIIRSIVGRRAKLELFDRQGTGENNDVLDDLIEKTGGSLRNLFQAINSAATIARRRGQDRIMAETAQIALEQIKSSISMRLEGDDYAFLCEIYGGKHRAIRKQAQLQRMMQAGAVLEYNGKRWHDVHPLVVDFLREIGEIESS